METATTLLEAGRGVAYRLALITLLVLAMLVLTLLNVSAAERSGPRDAQNDAQNIVPARRAMLSTYPAALGSSSGPFARPPGQASNGGCEE